jgi:hypothetical protein
MMLARADEVIEQVEGARSDCFIAGALYCPA